MPTPVWVTLVSVGPMALVFLGLGLTFRYRTRLPPFARTVGLVVGSVDVVGTVGLQFNDQTGRRWEVGVFYTGRPRTVGDRVPIVYNSRRPEQATIDGPGRDGTVLIVLAGILAVIGVVIAAAATLAGSV